MPEDIVIGRDESDKKKFGSEGLIYLGKHYIKMGQLTSLSSRIMLDVVKSHVVLISGKRGSGKSYSLGVIAEEITNLPQEVSENISVLIFDTMGIFWTMAYKNEKEAELRKDWNIEAKTLPVQIFVPYGYYESFKEKGIPADKSFAMKVADMNADDWVITFNLDFTSNVGIVIQRAVTKLQERYNEGIITGYDISDIIANIQVDPNFSQENKIAAINLFEGAQTWGIFAEKNQAETTVQDLIKGRTTTILDLSVYSSIGTFNVRALVIGLLSRKIFNERMKARKQEEVQAVQHGLDYLYYKEKRIMPMAWLLIDEAHEFLPLNGKTPATDALIQLLREGRQPGVSLVLATQQPGQIHRDVMTQSDVVVSHRVTAKPDVDALNYIMQSYVYSDIKTQLDNLPRLKGSAIILDDNSERIYPMRVRPRFTWHGGEAPTAIKVKKRI